MSGWIEVMIKGDCRAFLAAASVVGVMTSPGMTGDQLATPDQPMTLVMSSGETISGVYGASPNRIMFWLEGVKLLARRTQRTMIVAYLDNIAEFEGQVAMVMGAVGDGEAG